jgi:hypothetical protein
MIPDAARAVLESGKLAHMVTMNPAERAAGLRDP